MSSLYGGHWPEAPLGPEAPGPTIEEECEAGGHIKYGGPPGTEPTCFCGLVTYHEDGSRSWPADGERLTP